MVGSICTRDLKAIVYSTSADNCSSMPCAMLGSIYEVIMVMVVMPLHNNIILENHVIYTEQSTIIGDKMRKDNFTIHVCIL